MEDILKQIDNCTDKSSKYDLVIKYMESEGVSFTNASKNHIDLKYRILSNGSSIFVYANRFVMYLCDADKNRVERNLGIQCTVNYKDNNKQGIIDNVRPWTCVFNGAEMLSKVVDCILGKSSIVDINQPRKPITIENGVVRCPNCEYLFEKANRCPECGQLIKYDNYEVDIVRNSIDFSSLYKQLCECTTKKQLVETWNKYGLKTTTKPVDNETKDDKYLQFLDGSRIQISASSLKLWTSIEICEDSYFEEVRSVATPVDDGLYRVRRITIDKEVGNFKYLINYFIERNLA